MLHLQPSEQADEKKIEILLNIWLLQLELP